MESFILTGIGTDVGKTVVSAILCKAFELDYWKPIQTGGIEMRDATTVSELTSFGPTIFPERYLLKAPLSPHEAGNLENITISIKDFNLPKAHNLLIEGAGGLLVPINNEGDLLIDLFQKLEMPVVLVIRHYLGSINHSLLSIEALQHRDIPIKGLVFVGEDEFGAEKIITRISGCEIIARIPSVLNVTKEFVELQVQMIKGEI